MTDAASHWPALLRRHTGVEQLGPPGAFFAWTVIALSLVTIVFVGGWNSAKYPITLGYDYNSNADYMHVLLDDHRIPTPTESLESRQPPVYYLVGGLAARAGHWIFGWHEEPTKDLPEHSYRGAQILNVVFALLTALLLLSLARTAAPRSPPVWAAAVAFFAFLPVVAKTDGMIHPEPLNMLLSTTAVWLTTKLAARRHFSAALLLLVLIVLAVGLGTRASIVFTGAAIAIALTVRYLPSLSVRSLRRNIAPVVAVLMLIGATVFWISNGSHNASLASLADTATQTTQSHRAFFTLPLKSLFQTPYRANFVNAALPETYDEIWGDWIGSWAWSTFQGAPTGRVLSTLRNQNWIGVIPTALAIGGWFLLAWLAVRRRRELLAATLVAPIALAGYLGRSYEQLSSDGDLFKASYLLTTAPIWALSFGLAWGALARFPRLRLGLGVTLAAFAVLELRFMLYGLHDGYPPF
ncbi:MAG TPA: hypothetical protein VFB25_01145 [Gaiellaceae bacterium]|nr:hypothetical protein [Gaiellaceae bacterium]